MFLKLKFRYNRGTDVGYRDVTVWYQPVKGQPSEYETADFFTPEQLSYCDGVGPKVSMDKPHGKVLYHADDYYRGLFIGTLDQMKQFDQDDNLGNLSFEYICVDDDPKNLL